MDEQSVRKHAEAHGKAVVDNDMAALMADFTEEGRANLGPVAAALPQPVQTAEIVSLEASGNATVVDIRYSNAEKSATIRSEWVDADGRPKINAVSVV